MVAHKNNSEEVAASKAVARIKEVADGNSGVMIREAWIGLGCREALFKKPVFATWPGLCGGDSKWLVFKQYTGMSFLVQ